MNIEFKTHQVVVAGMHTQIRLLTERCIEWQAKLAVAESSGGRTSDIAIDQRKQLDAIRGLLVRSDCDCVDKWGPDSVVKQVALALQCAEVSLEEYDEQVEALTQAAASNAENADRRLKEALARSRASTKARSRKRK